MTDFSEHYGGSVALDPVVLDEPVELDTETPRQRVWILSNRGPGETVLDENGNAQLKWVPGGLSMVAIPAALEIAQDVTVGDNHQWGADVRWLSTAKNDLDLKHGPRIGLQQANPSAPKQERRVDLSFLDITPEEQNLYYNVISNTVQWMGHHGIVPDVTTAQIDEAWPVFRSVNRKFAEYVVNHAQPGDIVQVHDFQLALVGSQIMELAAERDLDIEVAGFWHIPFGTPEQLLTAFHETPDDCPMVTELTAAVGSIPMGFHRPQWQQNFLTTHETLVGGGPAFQPFVVPAYVDVSILRAEATADGVAEAMDQIRVELAEANGGKAFTGKVLGSVGRGDPKNGMDRVLDAYEILLEKPSHEPVALVLNVAPSRLESKPYREHWENLVQRKAEIERDHPEAVILLRHTVDPETGALGSMPRADAIALNRLADGMIIGSRAGGRDIVGQEAVALRLPDDGIPFVVASNEAGTSDTLKGVLAEQSRPIERDAKGHVTKRAIEGTGVREGAIIVENIGSEVPDNVAARRLAAGMKQGLAMGDGEKASRFAAMQQATAIENPMNWFQTLIMQAAMSRGKLRLIQEGSLATASKADFTSGRSDANVTYIQHESQATVATPARGNSWSHAGSSVGGGRGL